ncbi:MAG: hypothetical protein EVJ46_03760 [Candidatus Acididesulfobacter guangdongensis]|uniref:GGDEF domain-containing protein n=1 Tax=Acididesulfobacter guangdongensis TaxID=2597225 RepID=A0A519BJC1_ACIG2|nr:MAG: hypothetical protein EVJ46_03760 [Candidatus Acididesulfobacter guangdongensis]
MAYLLKSEQSFVLEILLGTTISEYKRIRKDLKFSENITSIDYLSLLYIKLNISAIDDKIFKSILGSLRTADSMIIKGKEIIVFLPGTDKEGVLHLEAGIREFLDDLYEGYVSVSYPEDGDNKIELINNFKKYIRLKFNEDSELLKNIN